MFENSSIKLVYSGQEIRVAQTLADKYDISVWYKTKEQKRMDGIMRTIDVFQCELNRVVSLEYIGKVKYKGETFGVDSLTDGKEYFIVKDNGYNLKVVDDSDEDYIYSLKKPAPLDWSSKGGIFEIIDDPKGILKKIIK